MTADACELIYGQLHIWVMSEYRFLHMKEVAHEIIPCSTLWTS